jgi:hypothetical protein
VLINPARTPEDPVQPDRLALMFLAIVLATPLDWAPLSSQCGRLNRSREC